MEEFADVTVNVEASVSSAHSIESAGLYLAPSAVRDHGGDEFYRAVVENVADGIAITVRSERVFVNDAFLAIHGLQAASEVVGHPIGQFVIEEDRGDVLERVSARLKGERRDKLVEYRICRPDGEIRTLQASVVNTIYGGEPAIMAVLRDVTDIRLAEAKIVRLNRELSLKVADLGKANEDLEAFNSMVSHDLRTPLMIIAGFCDRITKKYGETLDREIVDHLTIIRSSSSKMEQLIDDFLIFARLGKQAQKRIPISMDRMVRLIVDELRMVYPGGEVRILPLAPCSGDERMLRQVFLNLISNALKFSASKDSRLVEIGCEERKESNVYFVKDNGAGFDMNLSERLFGVFQRLHSHAEFEGIGMGLAIVKRIVGLHGGAVWAESKPGDGATFYVSLPRLDPSQQGGEFSGFTTTCTEKPSS
jgi:PAS domain S-box-containing protein